MDARPCDGRRAVDFDLVLILLAGVSGGVPNRLLGVSRKTRWVAVFL